jgi:hypothetical protein
VLYGLAKVFGINYPQKDLNIQLDEEYKIFEEFEAKHLTGSPRERKISDLYRFIDEN